MSMSDDLLPERAPIKKTHAGNFEIKHPYFKDYLFSDKWDAIAFWDAFRRGKNPLGGYSNSL